MKSAILIHSIALPAILASLLTVDLVANILHGGITVTGKNQSSDEKPVTMSQIPGDKAVCLGDNNDWTLYCADRTTVNYIQRISFAEKTQDPRPMIIHNIYGDATCNLTVTGEGDVGNLVWDVTNGQRGLLGYELEDGFETGAIKIECDGYYVDPAEVEEMGYESALEQARGTGTPARYGRTPSTSEHLQSGFGGRSVSGATVHGSGSGAE